MYEMTKIGDLLREVRVVPYDINSKHHFKMMLEKNTKMDEVIEEIKYFFNTKVIKEGDGWHSAMFIAICCKEMDLNPFLIKKEKDFFVQIEYLNKKYIINPKEENFLGKIKKINMCTNLYTNSEIFKIEKSQKSLLDYLGSPINFQ